MSASSSSACVGAISSCNSSGTIHQSPYDLRRKSPSSSSTSAAIGGAGSSSSGNSNGANNNPDIHVWAQPTSVNVGGAAQQGFHSSGGCPGSSSSYMQTNYMDTGGSSSGSGNNNNAVYMLPARKRPRRSYSMNQIDTAIITNANTSNTQVTACSISPVAASSSSAGPLLTAPAAHYLQYEMPDEVLLTIFSYLLEQDLCRLSLVCKRFSTISNDTELWKRMYQSVYEYDLPLFMPEPCKFVFVKPEDSDFNNPWKESFRQLYRGIHVRPGYSDRKYKGRRYFSTVQSALDYADERNNSSNNTSGGGVCSGNLSSNNQNGGPSGSNSIANNANNSHNSNSNNSNNNLVSQYLANNNSNQLPAGYANGNGPAPAPGGPTVQQQQPGQAHVQQPPTPLLAQQQNAANLPLNGGVADNDVVMARAASPGFCIGGSSNVHGGSVMAIEQPPQPMVSLIFLHHGHYRGEFLVIDSNVALIGAASGNVAESIILERESESTVMFVEGAKHAYVGHMTLKFSPDVTSTVPHHKHYCLEVGENCSPTIDHCIVRSTSVGELISLPI